MPGGVRKTATLWCMPGGVRKIAELADEKRLYLSCVYCPGPLYNYTINIVIIYLYNTRIQEEGYKKTKRRLEEG